MAELYETTSGVIPYAGISCAGHDRMVDRPMGEERNVLRKEGRKGGRKAFFDRECR